MKVLAIETTGSTCGAAVAEIEVGSSMKLLSVHEIYRPNVHDELLASIVESALSSASASMEEIDFVAVSAGPGSFTGIRIGMSLAKGLTLTGKPALIPVDTLEAIAFAMIEVAKTASINSVSAIVPSHRSLYYAARYDLSYGTLIRTDDHEVENLLSADESIRYTSGSLLGGPGAPDLDSMAISGLCRLSSRFVALRACALVADGSYQPTDSKLAEPLYRQDFKGNT